jgi:hypothetical protein
MKNGVFAERPATAGRKEERIAQNTPNDSTELFTLSITVLSSNQDRKAHTICSKA